ncbi:MAG: exodeoxyribonuclease VII large subunit, partial [Candidatus Omnitrophica bacterium]|nr:exodeoxyribonuclease VII large subunit [Candidatus Omnitrophota bacterium]
MTTYRLKMAGSRDPWRVPAPAAAPEAPTARPRHVYTVAELTREIKGLLEQSFAVVWVEGEISEPKRYPSGHLWFELKDERASVKCVMWRDEVARLKFALEQGLKVVCAGRVEFYAPRGELKFVAEAIEPKGLGALQLAFEQLCARLEKDGLFEPARKRPLPAFPRAIGIVTSPTGAAIEDMLRIVRGHVRVLLYP